jgi:hypothetical protein
MLRDAADIFNFASLSEQICRRGAAISEQYLSPERAFARVVAALEVLRGDLRERESWLDILAIGSRALLDADRERSAAPVSACRAREERAA